MGLEYLKTQYKKGEGPDNGMTFKSRILLGPIKKYYVFGRFPIEFVLHLALVIVSSMQLIILNKTNNVYSLAQRMAFYNIFLDPEFEVDEINLDRKKNLQNVAEMMEMVKGGIDYF